MKAMVLTFDCLPLRLLGCYGNQWIETPHFDRLASESIVFDSHFGENFDFQAANHAWWTGCYQFPRTHAQQRTQQSFGPILEEAGVRMQLIAEKSAAGEDVQKSGFRSVTQIDGTDGLGGAVNQTPFARMIHEAERCLDELAHGENGNWLLWLKSRGVPDLPIPPRELATLYLDLSEDELEFLIDLVRENIETSDGRSRPLLRTRPPNDENSEQLQQCVRTLFAGYVTMLDRGLGELYHAVKQVIGDDELLLIVTASAGADLGEREETPLSSLQLCEPLIHAPLLTHLSTVEMGSRRNGLVQTVDLLPTLLDWFGVESAGYPMEGRSLLPAIRDEEIVARDAICLGREQGEQAIRTDDFYLVEPKLESDSAEFSQPLLFEKPDDVWDIHDVADQFPEITERLEQVLEQFCDSARASRPVASPTLDLSPAED